MSRRNERARTPDAGERTTGPERPVDVCGRNERARTADTDHRRAASAHVDGDGGDE